MTNITVLTNWTEHTNIQWKSTCANLGIVWQVYSKIFSKHQRRQCAASMSPITDGMSLGGIYLWQIFQICNLIFSLTPIFILNIKLLLSSKCSKGKKEESDFHCQSSLNTSLNESKHVHIPESWKTTDT